MNINKRFRINCFICIGILVLIFTFNALNIKMSQSYAQFNTSSSTQIKSEVSRAKDIIKSAYIQLPDSPTDLTRTDKANKPAKIIITKSENCKSNPVVYFETTGRLSYYIQNINPIVLNGGANSVYEVPIYFKLNSDERNRLSAADLISGEIYLRYLNDFIKLPVKIKDTQGSLIEYTGDKLKNCYFSNYYNIINPINQKVPLTELKDIKVEYMSEPERIVITKPVTYKENPIIYFEVTGTLPYFVQQINPIELNEKNKSAKLSSDSKWVYEIPINIKLDATEMSSSSYSQLAKVEGQIIVRYLNDYGNFIGINYSKGELQAFGARKSLDTNIVNK